VLVTGCDQHVDMSHLSEGGINSTTYQIRIESVPHAFARQLKRNNHCVHIKPILTHLMSFRTFCAIILHGAFIFLFSIKGSMMFPLATEIVYIPLQAVL